MIEFTPTDMSNLNYNANRKIDKILKDNNIVQDVEGKVYSLGRFFFLYKESNCFYFRFFNSYGLWGKKIIEGDYVSFSERNGYAKVVKLFGWKFKILRP